MRSAFPDQVKWHIGYVVEKYGSCNRMKHARVVQILLVQFFLAGMLHTAMGQSLHVIRYSEDNGLTNSLVKSVATDRNGLIWVATDGGLYLFDGHEFIQYQGELPSEYVKSVFLRKNGDMIVTTDLGVLLSQSGVRPVQTQMVMQGSVQPVDSLLWFPKGCYEDQTGKLWFGDSRKIYCLDQEQIKAYFPGEKGVTNNFQRSFSFAEDGEGQLFGFAEPGVVYYYDPADDLFREVEVHGSLANIQAVLTIDAHTFMVATRSGLVEFRTGTGGTCEGLKPIAGSPEISCLYRHAPDRIYAGTWAGGLYEIILRNNQYLVNHLDEVEEKNINSIARGAQGNIWLASDNGLLLLQQNLFSSPFRQITSGYIQCISGDKNGDVLFSDGATVYRSLPTDNPYPSGEAAVVKRTSVTLLQAIPTAEGMWFSDVNARIWYENPPGKMVRMFDFSTMGRAVFHLKYDQNGNLWACQDQNPSLIRITPSFETRLYGPSEGITSRPLVTQLDENGEVYAGGMTDSAYLFIYDPAGDRFVNLSKPIQFEHNIDININDISAGKEGAIWLGSSFGLLKYINGSVSRVELGPMTGSSVKAVAVDGHGNLWLGNNVGLHLYANQEVLSFDDRTGMTSKIINYRCLRLDRSNRLWVGTVEGVLVSSPLPIPKKSVTPQIFSLLLNNSDEIPFTTDGITFNDRSFATLKVGVLDYPYVNFRLEMFLKGRDSVWQAVPRSGTLILANLPPGKYTLLLRAKKTGNYLTSDALQWNFTVTRIWYTREWVWLVMVVAVFLLFWLGLHLYTLNLKRSNERLEDAIRERTRETIQQKEHIEAQHASIILKNEELKQANIGLEKAKEIAEEASEAQKKFLSVMTHELRTPLNAVIGAAHLLIRNNPRQDQYEELQILRFSAENLLALINNILDFTKIESGKVTLEKIGFNLHNLVEEIVAAMKIRAKEKNITLSYRFDERLPDTVTGDPLRLSQIINNLMGNALKFTEQGSITIELVLRERINSEVVIDFFVRDTGIGMSRETLDNIFEIFVQGSSETTRKYGGTGLGLVITQKLLDLYGSEIKVESEPDKGTCFCFTIRFPEVSPAAEVVPDDVKTYEFAPFTQQRILLVEDNQINKLIAGKFLKDWNLQVDYAINGLVALDMVRNNPYALILMDIQMPEMDGYQASAAIRAMGSEPFTSLPIIALTAAIRSDVSAMIFSSGMNDFISKPFNPVDLHLKLRKYLG